MKPPIILLLLFIYSSCNTENKTLTAQQIIDKTIEKAGGSNYDTAGISFTFRDINYTSERKDGLYKLSRTFTDSIGETLDVLTNSNFDRTVNGTKIILADSTAAKYSNAINSVIYFVQLPYGLNAESVKKELVGNAEIDEKKYYEVKVTFEEKGGGTDHEDIYMYWINEETFTIDYFAYKFYTGEGGIRFRKAYNERLVNGIRFVDYKNYKVQPWESVDMTTLDELYEAGKLELLSEIETEDVSVKLSENK